MATTGNKYGPVLLVVVILAILGLLLTTSAVPLSADDDDEWKPDRIEKQVQQLERLTSEERRRMGVIYCGAEVRFPDRSSALVHPRNRGNLREAIIREAAPMKFCFNIKVKTGRDGIGHRVLHRFFWNCGMNNTAFSSN